MLSCKYPVTWFKAVFHGSNALDIVASSVLVSHSSLVALIRKALIARLGFVLYGDQRLH